MALSPPSCPCLTCLLPHHPHIPLSPLFSFLPFGDRITFSNSGGLELHGNSSVSAGITRVSLFFFPYKKTYLDTRPTVASLEGGASEWMEDMSWNRTEGLSHHPLPLQGATCSAGSYLAPRLLGFCLKSCHLLPRLSQWGMWVPSAHCK